MALEHIKNPLETCKQVYEYIKELTHLIRNKITESKYYGMHQNFFLFLFWFDDPTYKLGILQEVKLYHSETWELMLRRWAKLEKDFYNKKKQKFEISKIPDIYDCIKYDIMYNQSILNFHNAFPLYQCSKALADYVIPQVRPKNPFFHWLFLTIVFPSSGIWNNIRRKAQDCTRNSGTALAKNSNRLEIKSYWHMGLWRRFGQQAES